MFLANLPAKTTNNISSLSFVYNVSIVDCNLKLFLPVSRPLQVGQYKDSDVEKMIPFSQYRAIDSELEQLFRQVFVADPAKRPSAFTLLNHRRIKEGISQTVPMQCHFRCFSNFLFKAREYRKVFEEFDRETISDSRDIQGEYHVQYSIDKCVQTGTVCITAKCVLSVVNSELLEKRLQN